jgi:dipeptidyl aminopeptidase/acylaminoacyl peptidase
MSRMWISLMLLLSTMTATAGNIDIQRFRYAGPFALQQPAMIDSVDFNDKKFDAESLLETPLRLSQANDGRIFQDVMMPVGEGAYSLHLLAFDITCAGYVKAKLEVGSLKHYQLFVNGKKSTPDLTLIPGSYQFILKCLSQGDKRDSLHIVLQSEQDSLISITDQGQRLYSLSDVTNGKRLSAISLSHDGRYLISTYTTTLSDGTTSRRSKITDLQTHRQVADTDESPTWMPKTDAYYVTRKGDDGRQLVVIDMATGRETILASQLPEGYFVMSPAEDYLLLMKDSEGPKEAKDIYEIVEPDDRQPGWRDRTRLYRYDLKTGVVQPLTYGYHQVSLQDISHDGRFLLLLTTRNRLTQRPTALYSLLRLNMQTLSVDTLVCDDGFLAGAEYSPDGRNVVITASPEGLGGIGKNVPQGRIPSMYDYQLYTMDIATRKVTPLTKYFNPGVADVTWSKADGQIYFTALDRDYIHLFRTDRKGSKIVQIAVPEDIVTRFTVADDALVGAYYGEGASNSDRLYTLDMRSCKSVLQEDLSKEILKDIQLGDCQEWDFVNSRGDTICGRYYLPPHFDAAKKYPMIVNYYGGCSPTSRNFESRYPQHAYAALGYVVYVVNPSGAVGFGQEFSSRHVNTAGEGVAEDIIEGTRKFAAEHSFINAKKIGCIGASYGGFMTQYLQTKTDIFAAAISHAGISDHTSYWGEGYWGYSYSEVSMAGSYPWQNKDLYVDHSPLFNADKIHTPLLFLHGSADTNVPIGESIQMYTALKLLGRETALVVVDGENHHILDYQKRIKWQNTIFAWFAKWLKDDPSWWNSLYPRKNL